MAYDNRERNRYPAPCCSCGQRVPPGAGFLIRSSAGFRVRCEECDGRRLRVTPRMSNKKRFR